MSEQCGRSSGVTRRRFLRDAGAATIAASAAADPALGARRARRRRRGRQTVAVFGGGVAGLTAAHELAERGFDVTVYERRAWGGKARSTWVPHTAAHGRRPLPGEHGFRIVFGFYHNLPDTLRRIPYGSNKNGVFDNMVPAAVDSFSRTGRDDLILPVGAGANPRGFSPDQLVETVVGALQSHLPADAVTYFAQRLSVFLSSCDARRFGEWERVPWTQFIAANRFTSDYRRILGNLPQLVQASHADSTSTNWIGGVIEASVYNFASQGSTGPWDRPLNAPTNEAWIDPWLKLLANNGVKLVLGSAVEGLAVAPGRIAGARVRGRRATRFITADWYVCALPVERARALWTRAILAADPHLATMHALETGWMTGIQFYLRRRTPVVNGHVLYLGAPWAISSVSQAQFWDHDFAATYGDGAVHDCLSAIVANWDAPGVIYGKPARTLAPARIAHETWEQMKLHLNKAGQPPVLTDDLLHSWYLDPGITYHGAHIHNADPLTVPTVGTWSKRPNVATRIPNLLLAGDYTSGDWFVGTMESANIAGRLAANALLERAGSRQPAATVFPHFRPPEWETLKQIDEQRYKQGLPNMFDTG